MTRGSKLVLVVVFFPILVGIAISKFLEIKEPRRPATIKDSLEVYNSRKILQKSNLVRNSIDADSSLEISSIEGNDLYKIERKEAKIRDIQMFTSLSSEQKAKLLARFDELETQRLQYGVTPYYDIDDIVGTAVANSYRLHLRHLGLRAQLHNIALEVAKDLSLEAVSDEVKETVISILEAPTDDNLDISTRLESVIQTLEGKVSHDVLSKIRDKMDEGTMIPTYPVYTTVTRASESLQNKSVMRMSSLLSLSSYQSSQYMDAVRIAGDKFNAKLSELNNLSDYSTLSARSKTSMAFRAAQDDFRVNISKFLSKEQMAKWDRLNSSPKLINETGMLD
jgi:hypothetical protein